MSHVVERNPHNRAPRVAVVAYCEYPWDPRVRREAEALVSHGYAVDAITVRPRSGRSASSLGGVTIHEVPLSIKRGGKARYAFQYLLFLLLSSVLLWRLRAKQRLSVVHVHSLPDFQVFCALPLRLMGTSVLLDLHEAMPEIVAARFHLDRTSGWVRLAVILEVVSCRFADHVITANDGIRSAIMARGVPSRKVSSVYNPADISGGQPNSDVIGELALPAGRLLVHSGGVNPERDLETLLRAIARLPAELNVYLIIAGEGEVTYISDLEDLAFRLGLANRVRFVGRISHERAVALMSRAAIGLVTLEANPLTEIAWPTRITEFAGLGKPLIVPQLGFVRRMLQEGALYYEPGNPASLARQIADALTAPARLADRVAKAREVCARFEPGRVRASLLAVYRALGAVHPVDGSMTNMATRESFVERS